MTMKMILRKVKLHPCLNRAPFALLLFAVIYVRDCIGRILKYKIYHQLTTILMPDIILVFETKTPDDTIENGSFEGKMDMV